MKPMLELILKPLTEIVIFLIDKFGYLGIALSMAIESANIPLPSEIIMPFSGYLVSQGRFQLVWVIIWGTLGGVLGSLASYALGYFRGEEEARQLIRKYGKFVMIHEYELDDAIHWFDKYGNITTFIGRLLPIVRTFISLPAGIARMPLKPFLIYAALGSLLWSSFLAYLGFQLGENWHTLGTYFHKFDLIIAIGLIIGFIFYLRHKHHRLKAWKQQHSNSSKSSN